MNEKIILAIAKSLNIKPNQVRNTLKLMEEGATVPFIARYRKELTEGLDEEAIRVIEENYTYQVNLAKRKEDVLRLIDVFHSFGLYVGSVVINKFDGQNSAIKLCFVRD